MKKMLTAIAIGGTLLLAGCENQLAKTGWKAMTVEVPCGNRLETVTWKGQEAEFWMLYRPFRNGEAPEQHIFQAKSPFGVLEGKVVIVEKNC